MDFITILLVFKGFTTIFVVVDRWSKFEHFIPLKYDFTSVVVFDTFHSECEDTWHSKINCQWSWQKKISAIFGDIYSKLWALNSQCHMLTTHKLTGKLKLWRNDWSLISDVLLLPTHVNGLIGFHGHSYGIIPFFIVVHGWSLLKLFLAVIPPPCFHTFHMIKILQR